MDLANDGNYREGRYFSAWQKHGQAEDYRLPPMIQAVTGQQMCPIGDAALIFNDTSIASETCEELFTPNAPHIRSCLAGVEVISNGSGSHHQLRKLDKRLDLIRSATAKVRIERFWIHLIWSMQCHDAIKYWAFL